MLGSLTLDIREKNITKKKKKKFYNLHSSVLQYFNPDWFLFLALQR